MRYLGVDLHSNNFMVCFLSEDEEQIFKRFELSEIEIFNQCLTSEDRIAVEATGTTRFFYNQVAPLVAECVVVNPSQFEIIKKLFKKTDKNNRPSSRLDRQTPEDCFLHRYTDSNFVEYRYWNHSENRLDS